MKNRNFLIYMPILLFCACKTQHRMTRNFDTIIDYSDTIAKNQESNLHFSNAASSGDSAGWELKNKYAQMIGVQPTEIHNLRLYRFIDEWLGTKYLWGGTTKKGIDCSAFVQRLYAYVYDIDIPRTSIEQFYTNDVETFSEKKFLDEGDLVFFKTIDGNVVTHVGFYLGNNKFVNASSHGGVSIGSLKDRYWKSRYVVSGRIKDEKRK